MATQVKYNLPNNDFCVIDNGTSPVVITANGTPQSSSGQTGINSDGATLGLDTITAPAAKSQGSNPFGDTGSTPLDIVGNDTVYADPQCATFKGNPVSATPPTFAVVTKVLNDSRQGICVAWKNPA